MTEGYRQIVKSTGLVGIGQILAIISDIVRVKALALLVGTAGMGVAGLYMSALEVMSTISGVGVGVSGVRYIAAAEDQDERSSMIATVRRLSVLLGIVGTIVALVLSPWLAELTFGTEMEPYQSVGMAVVSIGVLFRTASTGQLAILRGLREIMESAAARVIGALFAAVAGTIVVWISGVRGIPAHILCVTGGAFLGSWFFARRHERRASTGGRAALARRSRQLVGIGSAAMGGALVNALGAYLIRLSVQRNIDLSAVGIYQATWVLCSIYVGVVLEAMGADFFPRLSGMQNDDEASRRIIGEQMEVAVLLAFPGVLFLLVVAPWALEILYAADFRAGTTLMRWQLLGVAVRAISWPLGFLLLSRAMNWVFLATQVVFNVAYIAGAWLGMDRAGLEGVGAAFTLAYLALFTVQWGIARLAIDFRLSWSIRATIGVSVTVLLGAWAAFELAPTEWAYPLATVALLLYTPWAIHRLLRRMNLSLAELWERVSLKFR